MMHYTDSLNDLSSYIIQQYYLKPYSKDGNTSQDGIERFYHGAQHVCSVAMLMVVLANLYRRYGYPGFEDLTDEDIKLLQIAALFHDSAREDDGEDLWDLPSALNCYRFLVKIGVDQKKAKELAEAIANKDQKDMVHQLDLEKETWTKLDKSSWLQKSIYSILIHDADCLEILRARDVFDAKYLYFYELIAKLDQKARIDMSNLICELRSLQDYQGNNRFKPNANVKKLYEHKDCFVKTVSDLDLKALDLNYLKTLYAKNTLLNPKELSKKAIKASMPPDADEKLTNQLHNGQIFVRGIWEPEKNASILNNLKVKKPETNFAKDFRKMKRDGGNPNRSCSLLGNGTHPPRCVGFMFQPDFNKMLAISQSDTNSGWNKKKNETAKYLQQDEQKMREHVSNVFDSMRLGGEGYRARSMIETRLYTHTEAICTIHEQDLYGIFYSLDPNLADAPFTNHPASPMIQAIYLQQAYKKQSGIELPIYEYSATKNIISKERQLNSEELIMLWQDVIHDYFKSLIETSPECLSQFTVESLKLLCIRGIDIEGEPLDSYYTDKVRNAINNIAHEEIQRFNQAYKSKYLKLLLNPAESQEYSSAIQSLGTLVEKQFMTFDNFSEEHLEILLNYTKKSDYWFADTVNKKPTFITWLLELATYHQNKKLQTQLNQSLDTQWRNILSNLSSRNKFYWADHIKSYFHVSKIIGSPISAEYLNGFFNDVMDDYKSKKHYVDSYNLYIVVDTLLKFHPKTLIDNADALVKMITIDEDKSEDILSKHIYTLRELCREKSLEIHKDSLYRLIRDNKHIFDPISGVYSSIFGIFQHYKFNDANLIQYFIENNHQYQGWKPFEIFVVRCERLKQMSVIWPQGKLPDSLEHWIKDEEELLVCSYLSSKPKTIIEYEDHFNLHQKFPFLGPVSPSLIEQFLKTISQKIVEGRFLTTQDALHIQKLLVVYGGYTQKDAADCLENMQKKTQTSKLRLFDSINDVSSNDIDVPPVLNYTNLKK